MGTTNIELIDLAKDLVIPNLHCMCKIKINQFTTTNTPINIIVNLNDSDNVTLTVIRDITSRWFNVNSHWCVSFINDNQNTYYSSFINQIPNQVKQFMIKVNDRKILSSNFQIQDFITNTCGWNCILIVSIKQSNKIWRYKNLLCLKQL